MTTAILTVGLDASQAYSSFEALKEKLRDGIPNVAIDVDEDQIRKRVQKALTTKPFGLYLRSDVIRREIHDAVYEALQNNRGSNYGWKVEINSSAIADEVHKGVASGLSTRFKVAIQGDLLTTEIQDHVANGMLGHLVNINSTALTQAVRTAVQAGLNGMVIPATAVAAAAKLSSGAAGGTQALDDSEPEVTRRRRPVAELGGGRAMRTRSARQASTGISVRIAEPLSLSEAETQLKAIQQDQRGIDAVKELNRTSKAGMAEEAKLRRERDSKEADIEAAYRQLEKEKAKELDKAFRQDEKDVSASKRAQGRMLTKANAKTKRTEAETLRSELRDFAEAVDSESLDKLRNIQFADPRLATEGLKLLENQLGKVKMAAALLAKGEENRAFRLYGSDAVAAVSSLDALQERFDTVKGALKGLKDLKAQAREDDKTRRQQNADDAVLRRLDEAGVSARAKAFEQAERDARAGAARRAPSAERGFELDAIERNGSVSKAQMELDWAKQRTKDKVQLEAKALDEIAAYEKQLDDEAEQRKKARLGRIYNAAKFLAASDFTGQGAQIAGAKALTTAYGAGEARSFLGPNKAFLVDLIPQLETYRQKVKQAKEDTSELARVFAEAKFKNSGVSTDFSRVSGAKALLDQFGEDKTRKFLGKDSFLLGLVPQLDAIREKAQSAANETARLAAIYEKAKFDASASGRYNTQGVKIKAAEVLTSNVGADDARKFLGPKGSFLVDLIPQLDAYVAKGNEGINVTKAMRGAMNDAHSAARGLAGSMGAMWLTWGNTAPLVAAAALGGAMRAVYSNGKDVEYQLGFVSALTGEAALSITQFNNALEGSMVAPTQAAEALRGLAQNGLNTREALAALPTVLDLATAGEMSLSEAALGATGVLASFNLGISEMGRVADVFTKAAALSNTSVSSMVEAMKQASTVSDQYGVSLEETAATLAVMAKRNIEGSAAGTAMRNMLVELASPTKAAKDAMAKLGMQFFDAQGNMRSYNELIEEVKLKTQDLNEKSRLEFLNRIFGERGGKAANALMSDLALYRETLKKLEGDSQGFTKSINEALKATTEGRVKQLMAEFKASTASAFTESKNSVDTFVISLNNAVASDQFRSFAASVTTSAAQTATALLKNLDTIALLAGGWVTLRLSMGAWAALNAQIPILLAKATAGMATLTAGTAGASVGMGALTVATNAFKIALGPLSIALSAAAALYLIFRDTTSESAKAQLAMKEALESSNRSLSRNIEAARAQLDYQTRYNEALRAGMTLEKAKEAAGGSAEISSVQSKISEQEKLVATLEARVRNRGPVTPGMARRGGMTEDQRVAAEELAVARQALEGLRTNLGRLQEQARVNQAMVQAEAFAENTRRLREFNAQVYDYAQRNPAKAEVALDLMFDAKAADSTAKDFQAELKRRTEMFDGMKMSVTLPADDKEKKQKDDKDKKAREANEKARAELDMLRKQREQRLTALRENTQAEQDLLENQMRSGLLTQEDYQVERARSSAKALRLEQEILRDALGKYQKVFDENVASGKGQNLLTRFQFGDIYRTSGDTLDNDIRSAVVPGTGFEAGEIENLVVAISSLNQQVGGFAVKVDNAQLEAMAEIQRIAKKKAEDYQSEWDKIEEFSDRLADKAVKNVSRVGLSALERARAEAAAAVRDIDREVKKATLDPDRKAGQYEAEALRKEQKAQSLFIQASEVEGVDQGAADGLLRQVAQLREQAEAARERAQGLRTMIELVNYNADKAKKNAVETKNDQVVEDFIKPEKESYDGLDERSKSMLKLVAGYQEMIRLEKEYADAKLATLGNEEKLAMVEEARSAKTVASYAMLAGAAKGMFKEQSSGYKALATAEKAFRTYQMIMSAKAQAFEMGIFLKNAFQRIFMNNAVVTAKVAGDQLSAASSVSTVGTEVSASMAKGQAAAAAGAAKQAEGGDPYTAFFRVAAMAALMAGLGFAVRSSNKVPNFAATNTGTGTVLGDPNAKSESLGNSMEALRSVNLMTARYSAQMAASLRNIENNIGGVATLLVRSGSINRPLQGVEVGFKDNGLRFLEPFLKSGVFGKSIAVFGQGLELGPQTLASARDGADARFYADIETKRKAFGVTYRTTRSTIYTDADEETRNQIGLVMTSFGDAVRAAASPLGRDLNQISSQVDGFVFNIGRIELSGLSAADQQARMMAVFSQQFDLLASSVLGGYEAFQKIGEGYGETVVRVATGVEQAQLALRSLGLSAADLADVANKQADVGTELVRQSLLQQEAVTNGVSRLVNAFEGSAEELAQTYRTLTSIRTTFGSIGLSTEAVTSSLLAGAGGLDNLTSALSSFEENFLTDTEKLSIQSTLLREEFRRMGLQMPLTADGFVALVRGLDTSTESGQELLGRVLQVSDSFYDMTEAIKNLGQGLEDEIKRIRELVNGGDVEQSPAGLAQLQAKFAITTVQARAGDGKALDELPELSKSMLDMAEQFATSLTDLRRLQLGTMASLQSTLDLVRGNATATVAGTLSVPAFATGGLHFGGARIVGENGPELEVTGPSRIFNAADTAAILSAGSRGSSSDETVLREEIVALRAELAQLRREQADQAAAIASNTGRVARVLERVAQSGDALAIQVT